MDYNLEMSKELVDELVELWIETKVRCDKIEELIKHLNEIKFE